MSYQIKQTKPFAKWLTKLKDNSAKARITLRLRKVALGHFGDHKQLSTNLFELRFLFGAGYRVYYTVKNQQVIFLLTGGDKATQSKDIKKAQQLLDQLED